LFERVVFIRIKLYLLKERERERVGSFYKQNIFLEIVGGFYKSKTEYLFREIIYS